MNWKNDFANPPRQYAILPMAHGSVSDYEKRLENDIKVGWGGVVANLRYTPDFPNNATEWKAMEAGCRAYAENGFKVWIYDEKGYPSGSAGGAVLEAHPEFESVGLICFRYWKTLGRCTGYRSDTPSGKLYRAYLIRLDQEQEAIDITHTTNPSGTLRFDVPEGQYQLVVFVQRYLFDATHAAHSYSEPRRYIDLFNPNATRAFLDCTYEKYAEYVGDLFGNAISAFFTDEPSLIGWPIPNTSYPMLSWSHLFEGAFEQKFGYSVGKALIAVCTGTGPDCIKRRCDFWDMTAELISENFFQVLQDWCHSHHTMLSGHLLNEENLVDHIYNYGSLYRSLKKLGQPGIDLLNSDPADLMSHNTLPIARLAGSVADVFDRKETMSESSELVQNMRKQTLPMDWLKATANWHFALGVNNITSYYNMSVFSNEELMGLNRYFARTGSLIRKGRRQNRVAVLYPENAMYANFQPTEKARNGGQSEAMQVINRSFRKVSWELLNRQIDFDYLDEQELQRTTLVGKKLCHTVQSYEVVVLPAASVLCQETYALLERFLAAGGTVIVLDRMPEFERETGSACTAAKTFAKHLQNGNLYFADSEQFTEIANRLPRSIRLVTEADTIGAEVVGDEVLARGILSHLRKDGNETVIYLCNMTEQDYAGRLEIPDAKSALLANPEEGSTTPLTITTSGKTQSLPISIPAYRGIFVVLQS